MQIGTLIKDALTKNRALKFFSLLLALTLWFFVMGEKKAEFSFADVPVEFINKPADLVVTHQTARSVNVRISGSRTMLTTLSSNNLKAIMDLEGVKPGTMVFNDLIDTIKLPNGTKITSITPAQVELTVEPLIYKRVPVVVDLTGDPAPGYAVQGVAVDPPSVEVSLGASEAAQLVKLMTKPLDISAETGTVTRDVLLALAELDVPRAISKRKVNVVVTIAPQLLEKILSGIPVHLTGSRYRARVVPATIEVRVQYPYHLEDVLSAGEIRATIDVSGLKPGSYSRQAVINVPAGISLLESIPQTCEVVVGKELAKDA